MLVIGGLASIYIFEIYETAFGFAFFNEKIGFSILGLKLEFVFI